MTGRTDRPWILAALTLACLVAAVPDAAAGSFEGLGAVLERRGPWLGLLAVFFGGMALNLTPCVYPMIPVTLAFFSGQASGATARTAWLAFMYVIGISLSYALLGVVAAKTGALLGSWLQQPPILIGVALLMAGLSLSLFGFYDMRLPQGLTQRFGRASRGTGGALMMGLAVGLIAAPCIGPFVLGLFLFVSRLANPLTGLVIFFVLGFGMGLPYVALALGTRSMTRLPKAGTWLVWSKNVLGVALLGMMLYVLKPLLPARVLTWSVAALLAGSGAYLGWLERTPVRGRIFSWVRRLTGIVLLLAGLTVIAPRPATPPGMTWTPFSDSALRAAWHAGRPVVVDVYADWCLPCVELDHVTFRHPSVARALADVATLRLDATRELPDETQAFLRSAQVYGVPTILLFDRSGQERGDLRVTGFVGPDAFLRRLEQLR